MGSAEPYLHCLSLTKKQKNLGRKGWDVLKFE